MSLFLEMEFSGTLLATGTGFVCQSPCGPVLVTNRHNVTGRDQKTGQPLSKNGGIPDAVTILHNRKGQLGHWVRKTESLLDKEGTPRWFEHPALGAKADFVALPLIQTEDIELYPYDISASGRRMRVGPADTVSVLGFPFGLAAGGRLAIWATGFMASEPDVDLEELPVFLIDCRTRQGQSGSAVIAYRDGAAVRFQDGSLSVGTDVMWELMGIYSGRINAESDIGMVWKTKALIELVASLPVN